MVEILRNKNVATRFQILAERGCLPLPDARDTGSVTKGLTGC
jgi:hypothetical protein